MNNRILVESHTSNKRNYYNFKEYIPVKGDILNDEIVTFSGYGDVHIIGDSNISEYVIITKKNLCYKK